MGWKLAEGDDFHSTATVEKVASGQPLTDEDRWPWLRAIGAWIQECEEGGVSAVITCSALRRVYRDLLRQGRPGVRFCHVETGRSLIADRLTQRIGHYMPLSLLPSQLATHEPLAPDEPGVTVSAAATVDDVINNACAALHLHPHRPVS
jgi:gluconokinase